MHRIAKAKVVVKKKFKFLCVKLYNPISNAAKKKSRKRIEILNWDGSEVKKKELFVVKCAKSTSENNFSVAHHLIY